MKILLDEGVPLRAAAEMRGAGIDAWHILELDMGGSSDQAVLERAEHDGAAIATLDADFHRILASTGATKPSVIRIRIEGLQAGQLAGLLADVIAGTGQELRTGAVVSVSNKRVRLRKLPLRG